MENSPPTVPNFSGYLEKMLAESHIYYLFYANNLWFFQFRTNHERGL